LGIQPHRFVLAITVEVPHQQNISCTRRGKDLISSIQGAVVIGIDQYSIPSEHRDLVDAISIEIADQSDITRLSESNGPIFVRCPTVTVGVQQPLAVLMDGNGIDSIAIEISDQRQASGISKKEGVVDYITTTLGVVGSLNQSDSVVGILVQRWKIHRATGGGLIRLIGQPRLFQHRFGIPGPLRTVDSKVIAAISIPITDHRKVLA
jgi:hypothetical protein